MRTRATARSVPGDERHCHGHGPIARRTFASTTRYHRQRRPAEHLAIPRDDGGRRRRDRRQYARSSALDTRHARRHAQRSTSSTSTSSTSSPRPTGARPASPRRGLERVEPHRTAPWSPRAGGKSVATRWPRPAVSAQKELDWTTRGRCRRARRLAVTRRTRPPCPHLRRGRRHRFPALASTSAEQGRLAACHAFSVPARRIISAHHAVQISIVGRTEQQLRRDASPTRPASPPAQNRPRPIQGVQSELLKRSST